MTLLLALVPPAPEAIDTGTTAWMLTSTALVESVEMTCASIDESGRALYNLAVAAEQRGDLTGALDLATRADAKLRATRTTEYMLELRDLIRV